MLEKIALSISNKMVNESVIDGDRRDCIAYGLSLILSALIITATIFTIGILTKTILPCIIYSAVFWTARNIVGLYHCDAYYKCFFLSVGLYSLMTISYSFSTSQKMSLIWLGMAVCTLIYSYIEILHINDKKLKTDIVGRFGKLCGITLVLVVVTAVAFLLGAKVIAFPVAFGMFVIHLLFAPATNPKKQGEMK
ncbi:accessory gene regulator B family protein [Ruminococcaceae bacterium OttesenSCG-928-I18]|nr:accessory gene regulator B family protein [Ruminococcaceae bacterium OttesenSCG-928-I18]